MARLVAPGRDRRPVVGIRAWTETEALGAPPGASTNAPPGAPVERLFRSLAAAVKDAGLPPAERPRLLVVARLRDLPESLPDELRHGLGDTAVHWWWGALGRLDTATAIAPVLDHAPGTSGRDRHRHSDPLAERIRRAVRSETVVEVCGPDLELARLLALDWDGAQHTLGAALGRCLARSTGPVPADCPPLRRIGALLRPGAELRQAWARGAVVSWEGRLRAHVGAWHPAAPAAPATGEAEDRLTALVSQAQQRVLTPWIEEARQRLAVRALGHLNRPVATLVAGYSARPPRTWAVIRSGRSWNFRWASCCAPTSAAPSPCPRATRHCCGSSSTRGTCWRTGPCCTTGHSKSCAPSSPRRICAPRSPTEGHVRAGAGRRAGRWRPTPRRPRAVGTRQ